MPMEFERRIDEVGPGGQRFVGYVDRIDRSPEGRVWVVDYKTGRVPDADDSGALGGGTRLQLPVYLLAAAGALEATAVYWYITARGGFQQKDYTATAVEDAAFARTIAAISSGVAAGAFPPVPGEFNEHWSEFANCGRCDFTRVCSRARGDDFARKGGHPAVGPWRDVAVAAGRGRAVSDDAARGLIRDRLDATMLVEAGAGTGKTRALVDRVVALVAADRRIDRIAAITFTERAAAELRDRVRTGLEEGERDTTDPQVRSRFRAALDGLDRAQLSTIHSFAQSLLRAFAAEAGVDPELTVLDELAAGLRFDERWRAALEGIDPDHPDGEAVDRALGLGLTAEGLRTLALRLQQRADLAADIVASPPSPPAPDWAVLPVLRDRISALPLDGVDGEDRCLALLAELAEALEQLILADGPARDVLLAANTHLHERKCGTLGAQGNWGGKQGVEAAREVARSVSDALGALLAQARARALADVLPRLARLALADAGARRREGTLVFDDLILWTRDLMRDVPSAREAMRARYDALLIDEFQDTDPWQAAIAGSFARHPQTGGLDPGRLFLVGDPKQSIYRFRRADMAIYAAEQRRVAR